MTIKVNKIYSEITVENHYYSCYPFPEGVIGGLAPGSLDHLTKVKTMRWGLNMTELIEPGVIPACCEYLVLPASYRHPIDASKLKSTTNVCIHYSNVQYAPTDRIFEVWAENEKSSEMVLMEKFVWMDVESYSKKYDHPGWIFRKACMVPHRLQPYIHAKADSQLSAEACQAYVTAKRAKLTKKINNLAWNIFRAEVEPGISIMPGIPVEAMLARLIAKRNLFDHDTGYCSLQLSQ